MATPTCSVCGDAYHAHRWLTENPDNMRDAKRAGEEEPIAW